MPVFNSADLCLKYCKDCIRHFRNSKDGTKHFRNVLNVLIRNVLNVLIDPFYIALFTGLEQTH